MRVVLSPQTESDLEEIGDYIALHNPRRALTFMAEIMAKCLKLGNTPGLGTVRPELGEGVRMLPHGRYLIFYRKQAGMIRIERVMHSARHLRRRLRRGRLTSPLASTETGGNLAAQVAPMIVMVAATRRSVDMLDHGW